MQVNKLVEAITEMSHEKELDRDQIITILEEVVLQAAEKKFPQYEMMEAVYNKAGDVIELFYYKMVVADDVYDENNEISLADAREIDADAEPEDELQYEIKPEEYMPAIGQTSRSLLFQKIAQIEREKIMERYKNLVGEIVHGTVGKVDRAEATIILQGRGEGILDRHEQIPMEKLEPGDHTRALLLKITDDVRYSKLILSRTHPLFLKKLMEVEIPEVYDKTVEIVSIAREPGRRAKVAVKTADPSIDPVGACIGQGGNRIHPITNELFNERIDVIEYSGDITVYISRALAPAQLSTITVNTETKTAEVEVDSLNLSKAIGRQGQNVRLASKLTGYKINVVNISSQADTSADFDLDAELEKTEMTAHPKSSATSEAAGTEAHSSHQSPSVN